MAASQRDPRHPRGAVTPPPPAPAAEPPDVLPPVDSALRSRLGTGIAGLGVLAVLLVAAGAPAPVRAPVVLLAALLLPGFPVVARLRLDLPTLLAVDVVTSLALEAGGALLMVKTGFWHPQGLGLALAVLGVGGTFYTLMHVRHAEARHLS